VQPCSCAALQLCSCAALQPCSCAALQPCSRAALQPCSLAALQPCRLTALQPYSLAAVQPCSHAAMQPCSHAAVQLCSLAAGLGHRFMRHVELDLSGGVRPDKGPTALQQLHMLQVGASTSCLILWCGKNGFMPDLGCRQRTDYHAVYHSRRCILLLCFGCCWHSCILVSRLPHPPPSRSMCVPSDVIARPGQHKL